MWIYFFIFLRREASIHLWEFDIECKMINKIINLIKYIKQLHRQLISLFILIFSCVKLFFFSNRKFPFINKQTNINQYVVISFIVAVLLRINTMASHLFRSVSFPSFSSTLLFILLKFLSLLSSFLFLIFYKISLTY